MKKWQMLVGIILCVGGMLRCRSDATDGTAAYVVDTLLSSVMKKLEKDGEGFRWYWGADGILMLWNRGQEVWQGKSFGSQYYVFLPAGDEQQGRKTIRYGTVRFCGWTIRYSGFFGGRWHIAQWEGEGTGRQRIVLFEEFRAGERITLQYGMFVRIQQYRQGVEEEYWLVRCPDEYRSLLRDYCKERIRRIVSKG